MWRPMILHLLLLTLKQYGHCVDTKFKSKLILELLIGQHQYLAKQGIYNLRSCLILLPKERFHTC